MSVTTGVGVGMNVEALRVGLRTLGLDADVRADGAVALLRLPPGDRTLEVAATRRAAVALATEHGFRNLALEVTD